MQIVLLVVQDDDQTPAITEATRQINACMADLESRGAAIVSVATQVVFLTHMTHWSVFATIIYDGGSNGENTNND